MRSNSKDRAPDLFKSQTMMKKPRISEISPNHSFNKPQLAKMGSTRSNQIDVLSESSTDREYYTKAQTMSVQVN